jgi:predicted permease
MRRVEENVREIPGVEGASFAYTVFDNGGFITDISVPGRDGSNRDPSVDHNIVGPDYLRVMKMPLVLGRYLDARDTAASRKVAVINETMARTYFGAGSPLGRTFGLDEPGWDDIEVVGVVRDAKYLHIDEKAMPAAFYSHSQFRKNFLYSFVVRYTGDATQIAPAVKRAVREIDPNLPVDDFRALAQVVDDAARNNRLVAQLSTFFGILATFLAAIGIYGVTSYGVTRRTGEFGIRMALGAQRRLVLWVVLRETLRLALIAAAIGLVLTRISRSLIAALLFGIDPGDPVVIAAAIFALIVVALLAGYLPARRATRIDPMTALRYE